MTCRHESRRHAHLAVRAGSPRRGRALAPGAQASAMPRRLYAERRLLHPDLSQRAAVERKAWIRTTKPAVSEKSRPAISIPAALSCRPCPSHRALELLSSPLSSRLIPADIGLPEAPQRSAAQPLATSSQRAAGGCLYKMSGTRRTGRALISRLEQRGRDVASPCRGLRCEKHSSKGASP